jgi:hypothetical protein
MSSVRRQSIPTREERAAQLKASERRAERDRLRDMLGTIAWCFAFTLLGLFLMACAMHTTDQKWGGILFWGALVVNNGGVMATLLFAFQRGQARGDW